MSNSYANKKKHHLPNDEAISYYLFQNLMNFDGIDQSRNLNLGSKSLFYFDTFKTVVSMIAPL